MIKKKYCSKCKLYKNLDEFSKNKNAKYGLNCWCKSCQKKCNHDYYYANQEKQKAYSRNYNKVHKSEIKIKKQTYSKAHRKEINAKDKLWRKKNPWKYIYAGIKQRCNNKKNKDYINYGKQGVKCLITEKEVKFLYERDKANTMRSPTIDRINNKGNYELSNCQFIERVQNSIKDKIKRILQYDLRGNYIKEYRSPKESSKQTKIDIRAIYKAASGKNKTSGGFIWRYK
jgi:hypothetical protein